MGGKRKSSPTKRMGTQAIFRERRLKPVRIKETQVDPWLSETFRGLEPSTFNPKNRVNENNEKHGSSYWSISHKLLKNKHCSHNMGQRMYSCAWHTLSFKVGHILLTLKDRQSS